MIKIKRIAIFVQQKEIQRLLRTNEIDDYTCSFFFFVALILVIKYLS